MRIGTCALSSRAMFSVLLATLGAVAGASASPALAASVPSAGSAPRVAASAATHRVSGAGKAAPAHKPAPALSPAHGTVIKPPVPQSNPNHKAELGGVAHLGPPHPGAGRLIIPPPSAAHSPKLRHFTPSLFYSSTQLDNFSAQCGFGVNETTIAQSTDNPNLVVAGANTYYDNSGNCQDSHVGVYYSSDGGQHWKFEVMPGLIDPFSGDPEVTYDPVRHVFLFAFVEAERNVSSVGRIGVEVSSDGVNWSRNTTLDSNNASDSTDKPSITVDQNPGSPHYGRVLVAWTEFFGNNALYQTAFTDDGGVTWHGGNASVNQTSHECGNGTSAAFNANGEVMVAWADCSGGTNSIFTELSTDGGTTWSTGVDHQITTTSPLAGAEDPNAADCLLNNGGSAFRCNSFPSLAGDPNGSDAGGTAFIVVWADVRSTTQSSQTANVSQLIGLSTVDDGSTWNGGNGFGFHFMAFNDFGDKFFPAASFSPNGRLTVSYSSREDDSSSGNPNGKSFDEHQTEAASLTNLRNNSYVSYTTDGTLGDPGSLAFIGDYAGNTSLDSNFDTFPVWTDLRNGFPSARTQDLCYADCMTFLSADRPLSLFRTAGSTFADFYGISMDPSTGSGADFWNVVGLRPGTSSTDDDTFLAPNRYYNSPLASSAFGAGTVDYTVINGNAGHAANTVYFPQVHSFSTVGGSYSLEWDAGHIVLGAAAADSMGSSNVARVYDTFLSTGTTYFFGLRPSAGNTSTYNLLVHSAGSGSYQARAAAVASSVASTAGDPAFTQYATGADPGQFDGVVVLNNNSGSGSYNLYRDTVAPSGTVRIDGGDRSTSEHQAEAGARGDQPDGGRPRLGHGDLHRRWFVRPVPALLIDHHGQYRGDRGIAHHRREVPQRRGGGRAGGYQLDLPGPDSADGHRREPPGRLDRGRQHRDTDRHPLRARRDRAVLEFRDLLVGDVRVGNAAEGRRAAARRRDDQRDRDNARGDEPGQEHRPVRVWRTDDHKREAGRRLHGGREHGDDQRRRLRARGDGEVRQLSGRLGVVRGGHAADGRRAGPHDRGGGRIRHHARRDHGHHERRSLRLRRSDGDVV